MAFTKPVRDIEKNKCVALKQNTGSEGAPKPLETFARTCYYMLLHIIFSGLFQKPRILIMTIRERKGLHDLFPELPPQPGIVET